MDAFCTNKCALPWHFENYMLSARNLGNNPPRKRLNCFTTRDPFSKVSSTLLNCCSSNPNVVISII